MKTEDKTHFKLLWRDGDNTKQWKKDVSIQSGKTLHLTFRSVS